MSQGIFLCFLSRYLPLLLSSLFHSHVSLPLCLCFPATAGCPKGALSANWAASQHREQERRGEAEIFMRQFSRKLKIFRSKSSPPPSPPPLPSTQVFLDKIKGGIQIWENRESLLSRRHVHDCKKKLLITTI